MINLEPKRTASSKNTKRRNNYLLVVDGDANRSFYLAMLLWHLDFVVRTVSTSHEALDTLSTELPALLIISSNIIGDLDGIEFVEGLKKNAAMNNIPFIAILHGEDLLEARRFCELGAVECLHPPITPESLSRAIQQAIKSLPRKCRRVRASLPVKVYHQSFDCADDMYTTDISEHGMFVQMKDPYGLGTHLEVQLDLKGRKIVIEAKVVYRFRTNDGHFHEPGVGLEFVKIAPQDQTSIRQFIHDGAASAS